MTRKQIALWLAGTAGAAVVVGLSAVAVLRTMELPPSDGPALAVLLHNVERKNLGAIRSVEYERDWRSFGGFWEIEVCRDACLTLKVDARTGHEIGRDSEAADNGLPPAGARGPSHIARSFEKRRLGVITEMEFDHGVWQVKFRDSRGLLDALKPSKRRVFEAAPSPLPSKSLTPRPIRRERNLLRVSA